MIAENASPDTLVVALAQLTPIWLDRNATVDKSVTAITDAAAQGAQLIAFPEGFAPGYPFWVERTNGALFDSPVQKALFAHYLTQAVQIEAGHLSPIQDAARLGNIAVMYGCIERPADRGGHSVYASLVYIDAAGAIRSVHRKLVPTYEERLVWSPGDGHGLQVHALGPFTIGGLNCWENWIPMARAALYGLGEDLHVAVWPGSDYNTCDITRFIARESRSYVMSVSSVMTCGDIPSGVPHRDLIIAGGGDTLANGGSCVASPDGTWLAEPVIGVERVIVSTINHRRVREERQNFDPSGHYARPDVLQLSVDRRRQTPVQVID
jgi:nitrilase